jgi:hypothetical protein
MIFKCTYSRLRLFKDITEILLKVELKFKHHSPFSVVDGEQNF